MHNELTGLSLGFPEGASVQQKSDIVLRALQQTTIAAKIKREVKDEIIKSKYCGASLGQHLPKLMEEMGCTVRLVNCIQELKTIAEGNKDKHHGRRESTTQATGVARGGYSGHEGVLPPYPVQDDNLDTLSNGRKKWRQGVLARLNEHAALHVAPFARHRSARTELARQARESALTQDFLSTVPTEEVVDPKETKEKQKEPSPGATPVAKPTLRATEGPPWGIASFYKHVQELSSANHSNQQTKVLGWGSVQLELALPSSEEIAEQFAELKLSQRQMGADEVLKERFSEERSRTLTSLLKKGAISELRTFAKRGVPVSLRKTVWKFLLEPFCPQDQVSRDKREAYLHLLQTDVLKVELLVDDFLRWDLRQCANDDKYFVFDDTLERVLLPLIRDPYCQPYAATAFTPITGCDKRGTSILDVYPPSGILPHERLAALCAPLCYLYTDPTEIYFSFRSLYCRYWVHLVSLNSKPNGILALSKLFERLVQTYNPDVVYHCVSTGIRPLDLAFPWISSAFSGYLEVDQLLHLWDRILAFDSLLLLPLLAAAVFLWRGRAILNCETSQDVKTLFSDFSKLQVIPLLQYFMHA